jgi:site-specific DNA-methyltransferase (adenine-specific)
MAQLSQIPQVNLNFQESLQSMVFEKHLFHNICSRICSFPPKMAAYFLNIYTKKGDICMDFFSGKGTLPLQALLMERIGIGNDISPEAYILTKAKLNSPSIKSLLKFLDIMERDLSLQGEISLDDENVAVFYSKETLSELLKVRYLLSNYSQTKTVVFTKAILLGILHGSTKVSLSLPCSHSYSMAPTYVKKYAAAHSLEKPKRSVMNCLRERVQQIYAQGIPSHSGQAFSFDSRQVKVDSESIDFIMSSPPYFAVQTYAYDNWLRLWFLGYKYKDVAKRLVSTSSEEKYESFMLATFQEMYRVLKVGSRCILIVGDVKQRKKGIKVILNTAEFLLPAAVKAGFDVEKVIVDEIPQTRKVLHSSLNTAGIVTERILVLRK